MPKSIIIDATHLGKSAPTGVELYTEALLPLLSQYLGSRGVDVAWVGHGAQPAAMPSYVRWVQSEHQSYWSQRRLPELLEKERPALFFTPSGIAPVFTKVPTAMTVHDLAVYDVPGAYTAGQKLRLHWLSRQAARKASLILTPSLYTKDRVVARWGIDPKTIEVTPLAPFSPAPISEAVPSVQPDRPLLLFVGRIERKKNLVTLVRGFSESTHEEAQLVLAGTPGYGSDELLSAVAALPSSVRERIIFTGYISPAQKRWLHEQATLAVVPGTAEGFGLTILEAFSFGVPVVAAKAGSLPEVGGSAVFYASPSQPSDWAKQIDLVLNDPAQTQDVVKKGKARVKEFTWEATAEETGRALLSRL